MLPRGKGGGGRNRLAGEVATGGAPGRDPFRVETSAARCWPRFSNGVTRGFSAGGG